MAPTTKNGRTQALIEAAAEEYSEEDASSSELAAQSSSRFWALTIQPGTRVAIDAANVVITGGAARAAAVRRARRARRQRFAS